MLKRSYLALGALALLAIVIVPIQANADGDIGDHVNDLKAHLDEYTSEVEWMIDNVDGLVAKYAAEGQDAVDSAGLIEWWEEVKFHGAIETNDAAIYSSIWQGLNGVKMGIDQGKPADEVRAQQRALERALWEGLGAVKLAARLQSASAGDAEEDAPATPQATIQQIIQNLDKVAAEHAEGESREAKELVHATYMDRFEGIEGMLIEQDAALVEDLEKDFNITLPQLLDQGADLQQVLQAIEAMKEKLSRADSLLAQAAQDDTEVF